MLAGVLGAWIVLRRLRVLHARRRHGDVPRARRRRRRGASRRSSPRSPPRSASAACSSGSRARAGSTPDAATGLLLVAALALGVRAGQRRLPLGRGRRPAAVRHADRAQPSATSWLTAAAAVARAARPTRALRRAWLATGFDPDGARALGVRRRVADRVLLARGRGRGGRRAGRRRRAARLRRARRARRHRAAGRARPARAAARRPARSPPSRAWPRSDRRRLNVGPGPAMAVLGARRRMRRGRSSRAARRMSARRRTDGARAAGYARRRSTRSSGVTSPSRRARSPRSSGPTAAARRRCSARCSASCRTGRGTVELAGRPAYVPQTERARLDFPVSALDVALMGAYGRTPWYRRLGRASARPPSGARARRASRTGRGERFGDALRRPAPARADRPRARAGRAGAAARRAAVGRRRARAPRSIERAVRASCAARGARCWSPPTTSSRRARWQRVLCLQPRARSRSARPPRC